MSFGKRQGWREAVVIIGRRRFSCRIVSQTSTAIVVEADNAQAIPYRFELLLDGKLLTCEVKFQRGGQVYVMPLSVREATGALSQMQFSLDQEATQWSGWRPARGFKS